MLLNVAFTLIRKSDTGLEENRNDLRWGLEVWKERRLWNPEPDGPSNQRIYEGLCCPGEMTRRKKVPNTICHHTWRGDQRSGRGQMQYENGELYEGEWLKDKHHGQGLLLLANGNRFVGTWSDGQKNRHGKFFYLDRGQLYESFWVDDVAKCGTLSDFGREAAVRLTVYPIPKVCLQDSQAVLMEAQAYFTEDKEKSTETTIPSHTIARQYVP
uniref:MORN repeat-containing protein 3 n=1 Tax=Cyprinus carpio TaxID=7962 RepID=A0A8C1KHU1_CYPCA